MPSLPLETQAPLPDLASAKPALDGCRACPLWRDATQGVPGSGPPQPPLALVGEQPGDQEDIAGRPFVGPAGRVLDRALSDAGIAREEVFVTNAVKHFKHEPRGKIRLHKKPSAPEVEVCRWWLAEELKLVQPKLIVALGATAALSVMGHKTALTPIRGQVRASREGRPALATVHPSFLLRLPDGEAKAREYGLFVRDLAAAKAAAGLL